ncbi:MAG: hypothetical protein NTY10_07565 [Candidatus Omnitrophica bacterium]|nr:hypothetical protein [Candidatus Omnitrophota bacterium]
MTFTERLQLFLKKNEKRILSAIIAYILLFGFCYSLYLGSNFRFIDEKDYYTIARNIAFTFQRSLDGIHPSAYHCPGYPFFLSIFLFLGANVIFLRFLNFLALALSVCLLYRILKEEAPGLSGIIGCLLVVCYPVLFYTAGMLYPQTITGTLLLGIVYLSRPPHRSSPPGGEGKNGRVPWIIGLLFGTLILFVPAMVLLLGVFLLWLLFIEKVRIKNAVIIAVLALCMVGCWTLRNYLVFKSFVFVNSNSGLVLLLGNSENTRPNAGVNVDISKYVQEADRLGLNEANRDRYYQKQALEFIRNNKVKAFKLYFLKLWNYFNYRNELGTKAEAARWKDILMLMTWGPLLALFLARLILAGRFKVDRFEGLLILLYLAGAFIHALFLTRIRYRLPFDFLLIMVVAMFLGRGFPITNNRSDESDRYK